MKTTNLLFIIMILSGSCYKCQSQLKLSISGLVRQESRLFIAVFDNVEDFLSEKVVYAKKIAISDEVAIIEIKDLPYGTYAISVFQDLNANEKLDKKMFGVPAEPYGFSVSPPKFTRAPTFYESAFQYRKEMEIKIQLIQR